MTSYEGALPLGEITIQHETWHSTGSNDVHGNEIEGYDAPVDRLISCVYPLHSLPHRDPVNADYMARYIADFMMEVPDATVYAKNDRVTILGEVFLVEGFPMNWGDNNPFGFDKSMFGGSVYIVRVT